MRLYAPTGVLNAPTDRNPTLVSAGSGVTIVTGGATTNLNSYTVPAGRRAVIFCSISGVVTTALAAGQTGELTVFVDPAAAVETGHARALFAGGEAVGTFRQTDQDLPILTAGDLVRINGTLAAGAGVLRTAGGITGVEYDA